MVTPLIISRNLHTLDKFVSEGLSSKNMVDFCFHPKKARLSRLYFLKIHKSPMGLHLSPTENILQF